MISFVASVFPEPLWPLEKEINGLTERLNSRGAMVPVLYPFAILTSFLYSIQISIHCYASSVAS